MSVLIYKKCYNKFSFNLTVHNLNASLDVYFFS